MAGESTADQTQGGIKVEEGSSTTWGEQRLAAFDYTEQQLAENGFKCKNIEARGISYGKAFSSKQPDSDSFRGIERSIVLYENRFSLTVSRYKRIPKRMREGPQDEELRQESVQFTVFNPRFSSKKRAELEISSLDGKNQRNEAKISLDGKGQVTTERLYVDQPGTIIPLVLQVNKENKRLVLIDRLGFSKEELSIINVDRATRAFLKLVTEGSFGEGAIFDPQLLRAEAKPNQV